MILLDTHAVVWWSSDPARLGARARKAIADADALGVPTIVFWEIALLARRRKIDLGMPVAEWSDALCSIPRVTPLPLSRTQAVLADGLAMHADPADRFIVAAAVEHEAALVTKDALLRGLSFVRTIW